jgi:chromosome segregation ATPase
MRKVRNITLFLILFLSSGIYSFAADSNKEKELEKKLGVLEQAIDKEADQIDGLRKDFRSILKQREQEKFSLEEKDKSISRLKKQVEDLRSDSGTSDKSSPLAARIKEKDNQIDDLESKLSESQKSIKKSQKQLDQVTQENDDLLSQVSSFKKKLNDLSKNPQEARVAPSSLKDKDDIIADLNDKLAVSQKKAEEAQDKVDQLKSVSRQKTLMEVSDKQKESLVEELQNKLDKQTKELSRAHDDLDKSAQREDALNRQLKEVKSSLDALEAESNNHKSNQVKFTQNDKEAGDLKSDIALKKQAIKDLDNELAKSLERETSLKKEVDSLKEQLAQAPRSVSGVSSEKEANQEDIQKELQSANERIDTLSKKLSNDTEDYSTLSAKELQEKAQEIERMRRAIEAAIARLDILISNIVPAH